jgi:hypothetical protein
MWPRATTGTSSRSSGYVASASRTAPGRLHAPERRSRATCHFCTTTSDNDRICSFAGQRQFRSADVRAIAASPTTATGVLSVVAATASTSDNEVFDFKRAADEAEHLPDHRSPHRAAHPSEIAAHVSLLR